MLLVRRDCCNCPTILAKNTGTTLSNEHTFDPLSPPSMLQVFGQIFALRMTQPASSYTVE